MPTTDAVHFARLGTITATANLYFFVTPETTPVTILDVELYSSAAVAADPTDKWTFQITNVTDSVDMLATGRGTATYPLVAGAVYPLQVDQNRTTVGAGKLLKITATKGGSGADLTDVLLRMTYRIHS